MNPTTSHESRTTKPADKKNDGGGDAGDVRTGGPAARVDPDDSDDSDLDGECIPRTPGVIQGLIA